MKFPEMPEMARLSLMGPLHPDLEMIVLFGPLARFGTPKNHEISLFFRVFRVFSD